LAAGFVDTLQLPVFVVMGSMIGYGSLARETGFSLWLALVATGTVWSLPAQMAMAELYTVGASGAAIALAMSLANLRFLPMAVSLTPLLGDGRRGWRYVMIQMISVNTWVGSTRRCPQLPPGQRGPYYVGYATACMIAGLVATAVGYGLAGTLPRAATLGMVFLNPVYFALVFADVRQRAGIIALLAGAIVGPLIHLLAPNWGLVATGVLAGTAAYLIERRLEARHG